MRTLRDFIRSLADVPRGSAADGRGIGIGLDAALRAQRTHGAEALAHRSRRARPATDGRPFTPA
jgi:hypothetical protein